MRVLRGGLQFCSSKRRLPSTQILVARALGNDTPSYCHLPLVVGPDGRRLAKRHGDTRVASFREAGWSAERVIGLLAASCGWAEMGEELPLAALLPRCSRSAGDEAVRVPATACAAHFVRVIPARAPYHPCEKVKLSQGC